MKANCLTRALDQWNENREEYRLWYNSNHVICMEGCYEGSDLTMMKSYNFPEYLPLSDFGIDHFRSSFSLTPKYIILLTEYLETE